MPYLADVARLEAAWTRAYHAADAAPLTVADLAAIPADELGAARLSRHPAAELVRSAHPVGSIWAAHQSRDGGAAARSGPAETVLVTRPAMDVSVHVLPARDAPFAAALSWRRQRWPTRPKPRSRQRRRIRLRGGTCRPCFARRVSRAVQLRGTRHDRPPKRLAQRRGLGFLPRVEGWLAAIPQSLPLLALRVALAVPFYKSGLTKWDGFLQLSGGAEFLFAPEFKLHIFGSQYPYPFPMVAAYGAGIAEIVLPILLVLGLVHALRRARPAVHDGGDPAHRAGGLGELPPALGGDGADAGGVRRRADRRSTGC